MPRVPRICLAMLVLLVAAGCGDDTYPSSKSSASTSPSSTPSASATDSTASPTETALPTPTEPTYSTTVKRTSVTINHNGQPIDEAGLRALGWTILADAGEARWIDPALGNIHVVWELPPVDAHAIMGVKVWGDVTGNNLAMAPSIYTTGFLGGPVETGAHSLGGVTAEAPERDLRVDVIEQLVGAKGSISFNLGWPQPVLVTYNYDFVPDAEF